MELSRRDDWKIATARSTARSHPVHRDLNFKPPLENLAGVKVQVFSISVPKDESGEANTELYVIEAGKIVRVSGLGIKDDLFSNRLRKYIADLGTD